MKKYTVTALLGLILGALLLTPATAATVRLGWDPNTESDLAGYRMYVGTASRSYTTNYNLGLVTTLSITNLAFDTTYYFAVTAVNAGGLESVYSNEVTYRESLPSAPAVPAGIAVIGLGRGLAGIQFNYADATAATFNVYTNGVRMLTVPKPVSTQVSVSLPALAASVDYRVQVTAVGTNSLESARSAEAALRIPGATNLRRN